RLANEAAKKIREPCPAVSGSGKGIFTFEFEACSTRCTRSRSVRGHGIRRGTAREGAGFGASASPECGERLAISLQLTGWPVFAPYLGGRRGFAPASETSSPQVTAPGFHAGPPRGREAAPRGPCRAGGRSR